MLKAPRKPNISKTVVYAIAVNALQIRGFAGFSWYTFFWMDFSWQNRYFPPHHCGRRGAGGRVGRDTGHSGRAG